MALFSSNKKAPAKKAAPKKKEVAKKAAGTVADARGRLEGVLKAPWLSEKALIGTEKGVYVFEIPLDASKTDVAKAVEKIYNVVPRKVTVANVAGKRKALRHKRGFGTRSARRKAYVHLAKGDSITLA